MKIEKIDENKIKVMIDEREAKEWNISFQSISENTQAAQDMFWAAIQLAERDVDFSIDGASKLFVEAVPGTEEGFSMMITRVSSEEELSAAINNCGYKGRLRQTEMRFSKKKPGRRCIYSFRDFDSLCAAAGQLAGAYLGESALYKCGEGFYLCILPDCAETLHGLEMILPEFGSKVRNSQFVQGWLNEYGQLMIEDRAVEVLGEYFCVR